MIGGFRMKNLMFVNETMGVGKATSKILQKLL